MSGKGTIEDPRIPKWKEKPYTNIGLGDSAQMVLWDKSDYKTVSHFYDKCNELTCTIYGYIDKIKALKRLLYNRTITDEQQSEMSWLEAKMNFYANILNRMIDKYELFIYHYKNADMKNGFELLPTKPKVEPQTISIRANTVVDPALVIYAKLISNFSVEEFRYIASGTGDTPTKPNQNTLSNENSRLDIFVNSGFRQPNGDSVKEGVVFPPGLDDALVTEFGSFTLPGENQGTMQWRNVIDITEEQIQHDQGNTFYSIAHQTMFKVVEIQ